LVPIKCHLVKYSCAIRTDLYFYGSFFAAYFSSKQSTSEIDSSHSKSKIDQSKIKDGIDVDLKESGQEEMGMHQCIIGGANKPEKRDG
jgi:hypothetical protein